MLNFLPRFHMIHWAHRLNFSKIFLTADFARTSKVGVNSLYVMNVTLYERVTRPDKSGPAKNVIAANPERLIIRRRFTDGKKAPSDEEPLVLNLRTGPKND